jgi:hypothetical protein
VPEVEGNRGGDERERRRVPHAEHIATVLEASHEAEGDGRADETMQSSTVWSRRLRGLTGRV